MVWMQPDQATENRCEVTAFTCTSAAKGITLLRTRCRLSVR